MAKLIKLWNPQNNLEDYHHICSNRLKNQQ